ncbi:MAG: RDD family protein [Chitinophagaceae bacterium]|nr:RDD family protein [Chitinophagaceae bacterium]
MNTIKITTSQNIELEYQLAGLGERIVAGIVDTLVIFSYLILIVLVAYVTNTFNMFDDKEWMVLLFFAPVLFYHLLSELLLNGQSVGKKVMNIKVVSLDGAPPTLGQYLIRWVFRPVDLIITSYACAVLCIAISERKQRLGDMVAGTTLIRTIPRTGLDDTIYAPTPVIDYTVSFPDVIQLSDKDMQLIKEVIVNVNKTGNSVLAYHTADKIKQTLNINANMDPMHFLHVIIADYNYLTARL